MKKFLICILFVTLTGCAGWKINGVPAENFKHMTAKAATQFIAGMGVSYGTHILGHVGYMKLAEIDYHMEGTREVIDSYISSATAANIGRSGAIAQLLGGLLLKYFNQTSSMFNAGYNFNTFLELSTYPLVVDNGDIDLINENSNGNLEWGFYTLGSIYLLDIDFK